MTFMLDTEKAYCSLAGHYCQLVTPLMYTYEGHLSLLCRNSIQRNWKSPPYDLFITYVIHMPGLLIFQRTVVLGFIDLRRRSWVPDANPDAII